MLEEDSLDLTFPGKKKKPKKEEGELLEKDDGRDSNGFPWNRKGNNAGCLALQGLHVMFCRAGGRREQKQRRDFVYFLHGTSVGRHGKRLLLRRGRSAQKIKELAGVVPLRYSVLTAFTLFLLYQFM